MGIRQWAVYGVGGIALVLILGHVVEASRRETPLPALSARQIWRAAQSAVATEPFGETLAVSGPHQPPVWENLYENGPFSWRLETLSTSGLPRTVSARQGTVVGLWTYRSTGVTTRLWSGIAGAPDPWASALSWSWQSGWQPRVRITDIQGLRAYEVQFRPSRPAPSTPEVWWWFQAPYFIPLGVRWQIGHVTWQAMPLVFTNGSPDTSANPPPSLHPRRQSGRASPAGLWAWPFNGQMP